MIFGILFQRRIDAPETLRQFLPSTLIAGVGRSDLNHDGRRERTAMSLLRSMGLPGSLTRRRFLAGSAAAGAVAGLGPWGARAAPNLSGVTLNLMVIQPHVVGGRMVGKPSRKRPGPR